MVRARHVRYTLTDPPMPVVALMPDAGCIEALPSPIAARQVGYTSAGFTLNAWAWECCDALCTDAEELSGECWKVPECWPLGPGPGIAKKLALYLFDAQNCWTARRQNCPMAATLVYDDGDGKWHADVILRGGTLHITFACNEGADPGDPGKFTISWTGCDTGSVSVGYACSDPLLVNSGNVSVVQHCCDCNESDPGPTTDNPATINFIVAGNCRRQVMARHVGYSYLPPVDDLPARYFPVVANTKPCTWHQDDCYLCGNMTCPLNAEITAAEGVCSTLVGFYAGSHGGGGWSFSGGPAPITTFTVACTDLGDGPINPDTADCISCGHVRLDMTLVCGTDNVFTFGSVTVNACDLENLDVTFTGSGVSVEDPAPCCTGAISVHVTRF